MNAGELPERLHCPYRDFAGRELGLELLGKLEDSHVLTDPGLRGLQALGDALEGQAGLEQPLIAAGPGEGAELPPEVVLEQGLHEEVGLFFVASAGWPDNCRQFHDARLHGCAVSALAGDQHVMGNCP
jgi:hypothetical protein